MKRDSRHDRSHHRLSTIVLAPYRAARSSRLRTYHRRFVTQTHALGAPRARPGALLIIGLIAIVLYVVGRRISR